MVVVGSARMDNGILTVSPLLLLRLREKKRRMKRRRVRVMRSLRMRMRSRFCHSIDWLWLQQVAF